MSHGGFDAHFSLCNFVMLITRILVIVLWAALAFAIIRGLLVAWGFHRRLASATGVAVACAFALGAISPFALPNRLVAIVQSPSVEAQAPAAPASAPTADTSHAAACPPGTVLGSTAAPGHVDEVTADGAGLPTTSGGGLDVSAGSRLRVSGWIVPATAAPGTICTIVDGRVIAAPAVYGITRPDVAVALRKPADGLSGFVVTLNLKPGSHKVTIGAMNQGAHTLDVMRGAPTIIRVH